MNTKIIKYIFIVLINTCTSNLYSQSDLYQFGAKLKSMDESVGRIEIDTSEYAKNKFNGLSTIESGEFKGVLTVFFDSTDNFSLLIYSTLNDSTFKEEVKSFHSHASCTYSKDSNLYYNLYRTNGIYYFLPMYPCWTNGYSEKSKQLLSKLKE